jgi:hypothetical protein
MCIRAQPPFFQELIVVIKTEYRVGISYIGNTEQEILPFDNGNAFYYITNRKNQLIRGSRVSMRAQVRKKESIPFPSDLL